MRLMAARASVLRATARLATRRRQTVLATAGPGFLGCLGHGDWATREALEAVADDAGNTVPLGGAGCVGAGWAHSACVVHGKVLVWGRYLEPPTSALRLSRLDMVLPIFARLVNATALAFDMSGDLALRPVPVALPTAASKVACGAGVTAIVDDAGALRTFGANAFGQCGVGAFGEVVSKPADVVWHDIETPPKVVDVALGFRHGLALGDDGGVYSWGKDDNGQLGIGGRDASPALRRVDVPDRCVAVACGLAHSAALTDKGQLYVWGKMRDPTTSAPSKVSSSLPDKYGDALKPRLVPMYGTKLTQLACSNFHTAVADDAGAVYVAGLERGSREMVHAPRRVTLPAGDWTLRSGVDAVALVSDSEVRAPDLVPGLACEADVRLDARVDDAAFGWKHAVAAARFNDD